MEIVPLITVEEADAFLSMYPDWLALTTELKEHHIMNATYVLIAEWTCPEVDWSDPSTLDETIKEACARLAYIDYKGTLYTDPGLQTGEIKREKVDVLEVEYFEGDGYPYQGSLYPDVETMLSAAGCSQTGGGLSSSGSVALKRG